MERVIGGRGQAGSGRKKAKISMKQILMVLKAMEQGAETSTEVSAITDLPVKHCSAWLNELRNAGLVRIVRRDYIRFDSGKRSHQWALERKP